MKDLIFSVPLKRLAGAIFFTLLSISCLIAQQRVSGTVTDSNGSPLIGVNILELGTSNGTITDLDGKYDLEVSPEASLVFSYTVLSGTNRKGSRPRHTECDAQRGRLAR